MNFAKTIDYIYIYTYICVYICIYIYVYKISSGIVSPENIPVYGEVDCYHVAVFYLHVPTTSYMKPHSSKAVASGSAAIPSKSDVAYTVNMID